jgi:endonuclease/exonuclease/phosphatase (EEP) superfamily protein YafD
VHIVGTSNPGLAVVTVGREYRLARLSPTKSSPDLSCLLRITGPPPTTPFGLAAVWPVDRDNRHPYHDTLMQALECHGDELRRPPAIMAGDLNSSTRVKDQAKSHSLFVDAAREVGLESVYHHHAGEDHGAELLNTYVHGKKNPVPFHIDYCFVSRALLPAATITIPQSPFWAARSDHYPLILDIPDSAMREADASKQN